MALYTRYVEIESGNSGEKPINFYMSSGRNQTYAFAISEQCSIALTTNVRRSLGRASDIYYIFGVVIPANGLRDNQL